MAGRNKVPAHKPGIKSQVKLKEINTLDLARQFIIFAAVNAVENRVVLSVPQTNMSVETFASYAEQHGVLTPALADAFKKEFTGEQVRFYVPDPQKGSDSQVNMLLDGFDLRWEQDVADDVMAVLYAVIFLHDESFRNILYERCLNYRGSFTMKDIKFYDPNLYMGKELSLPFGSF